MVRRGTIRLPPDVAARVRAGHPWVYREVLGSRPLREAPGAVVELVDSGGEFVGRGIYDGESVIAVRVMTRNPEEPIDSRLVARRVQEAASLRRRFVPQDVDAFRVVNVENDGLPAIAVDRYADYLVVLFFSPAVLGFREALLDALEKTHSPKGIYEQKRFKPVTGEAQRGPAELVRGSAAPVELEVREGPLKFWVDVTAPTSPGLFLDLREGRRAVAGWAEGRRVLNLFSYTGAISVHAQHGGAREILAVDAVAKGHARARRNFALNGFDPEKPEHVVGDVFKVLAKLADRGRKFDLVVMDPPAFGMAGRQAFSAAQDYRDLVEAAIGVLAPGGLLVAVSSTHKISHDEFDRMLADGAARGRAELRIIERRWLPPDFCVAPGFPEGNYLKFAVAVRD
ncbi:MAG: class I SAM-dependent rRNA methyltransferase [Deltaproteobacteria bacterium]|nr:class I SAM-dependent rRNA methyltransferase [Deltaproteobacteria bacterium]